jgi:hypothetical protein
VEGGNGARIGAVIGIDVMLFVFALIGLAGLTFRFRKREGEAL